jgi:thiamine biosynthesis lipoprotein
MATEITVRTAGTATLVDETDREPALARALAVFNDVETACSRFDATSPLTRANREPRQWHDVGAMCLDAIVEAWRAYELTEGRFDPRVLSDLEALGYDRSLPFADGLVSVDAPVPRRRLSRPRWCPQFRPARGEVRLGGLPVDLGGVGKGLAVRWASNELRPKVPDFVINAGGDCYCAGRAPDGGPWLVGVENPSGQPEPIVVLALSDRASTTSSIRVRRWSAGGVPVHHLIDPRSGLPGGPGLVAVTVVASDPAEAEVWSKVLFLAGSAGVAHEAARRSLAACWVADDGRVEVSEAMERFVVWRDRP